MLFDFHIARGDWAGYSVSMYELNATAALAALRRMTEPGCTPRIEMRDVETCFISEEPNHSPVNAELIGAAHTVANHFWEKLHHCVDVTVQVLDNN